MHLNLNAKNLEILLFFPCTLEIKKSAKSVRKCKSLIFTDFGGLFLTAGFGVAKGLSGETSLFLFHAGSVIDVWGGGRMLGVVVWALKMK